MHNIETPGILGFRFATLDFTNGVFPMLAYSYLRFNFSEQAKGDSIRRQVAARDAYLTRKGLTFDTSFVLPPDNGKPTTDCVRGKPQHFDRLAPDTSKETVPCPSGSTSASPVRPRTLTARNRTFRPGPWRRATR